MSHDSNRHFLINAYSIQPHPDCFCQKTRFGRKANTYYKAESLYIIVLMCYVPSNMMFHVMFVMKVKIWALYWTYLTNCVHDY